MECMISIITPIYQAEKFLDRSINSVLNQEYRNIELILIDDGSTDNSYNKCKRYQEKDSRIRLFKQNNQGVSATRNKGIDLACGDYVLFLDADDYIEPGMVKDMLSAAQLHKADVVVCGYKTKLNRKYLNEFDTIPNIGKECVGSDEFKTFFWHVYDQNILHNIGTKLYKKSLIQENKIYFDIKYSINEDVMFTLNAIKKCERISFVSRAYYYYYVECNRFSLNSGYRKNHYSSILELYKNIEEIIVDKNEIFAMHLIDAVIGSLSNEFRKKLLCIDEITYICNQSYANIVIKESLNSQLLQLNYLEKLFADKKIRQLYFELLFKHIKEGIRQSRGYNQGFDILYGTYLVSGIKKFMEVTGSENNK